MIVLYAVLPAGMRVEPLQTGQMASAVAVIAAAPATHWARGRKITPLPDRTSIQSIRLDFVFSNPAESISVELPTKLAKGVAETLSQVVRSGNNPTPTSPGPSGARPKLRIVKS
jgi:hypothetical protein